MTSLERTVAQAIVELIDEVVSLRPKLKAPLDPARRALEGEVRGNGSGEEAAQP